MRLRSSVIAFALTACACFGTAAQNLFKCGATFQDKPCDAEVQKKYSRLTGSFSKEQVTASADNQCADLGLQALPIIQSKMRNEPVQGLHAQVDQKPLTLQQRAQEKDLITAVYSRSGSATDIRGSIESDCMDRKRGNRTAAGAYYTPIQSSSHAGRRVANDAARAAADAARR
ncbi:MAG: hypothetical protein V4625_05750 [Pseudomonadota bacterium]